MHTRITIAFTYRYGIDLSLCPYAKIRCLYPVCPHRTVAKNLPKIKNRLPAHPLVSENLSLQAYLKSHNEVSSGRPYHSRNGFIRCHTEIDTMQRCTGYSINDEHATLLTIVNRCKGVVSENRLCKQFFQFAGLQTCCKFLVTSL